MWGKDQKEDMKVGDRFVKKKCAVGKVREGEGEEWGWKMSKIHYINS